MRRIALFMVIVLGIAIAVGVATKAALREMLIAAVLRNNDSATARRITSLVPSLANTDYDNGILKIPLLMGAITARNRETAHVLVAHGAKVNVRNHCRQTPLMLAAEWGDVDAVRLLIAHGAKVNAVDVGGETALYKAVESGHFAAARLLRYHGGTGMPLLSQAAAEGDVTFMREELLRDPRGSFLKDAAGGTALHQAALHGHLKAAQFLMQCGGDPVVKDDYGRTPFRNAAASGNVALVRLLLTKKQCRSPRMLNAALEAAVVCGNPSVTELLISSGANVDSRNRLGYTMLEAVAIELADNTATSLATVLLANGAVVNATESDGYTALHFAAVWNKPRLVQLLLDNRADPTLRTLAGDTALQLAKQNGSHAATSVLSRPSTLHRAAGSRK